MLLPGSRRLRRDWPIGTDRLDRSQGLQGLGRLRLHRRSRHAGRGWLDRIHGLDSGRAGVRERVAIRGCGGRVVSSQMRGDPVGNPLGDVERTIGRRPLPGNRLAHFSQAVAALFEQCIGRRVGRRRGLWIGPRIVASQQCEHVLELVGQRGDATNAHGVR